MDACRFSRIASFLAVCGLFWTGCATERDRVLPMQGIHPFYKYGHGRPGKLTLAQALTLKPGTTKAETDSRFGKSARYPEGSSGQRMYDGLTGGFYLLTFDALDADGEPQPGSRITRLEFGYEDGMAGYRFHPIYVPGPVGGTLESRPDESRGGEEIRVEKERPAAEAGLSDSSGPWDR